MLNSLPSILPGLSRLTLASVIDILAVAVLIYQFLMMIRGRRAAPALAGLGILGIVYAIAVYAQLELLRTILAAVAPYTAFALIVMFQSELRRILARIGHTRLVRTASMLQRREMIQEIILAITKMAAEKTGALIIVEREVGLRTFIESGVPLDAWVSRDLLLSIFEHSGALHDGAVVIQRDRVAAAGCFLPLTMNPALAGDLGTRHRAAIGITEEADCISIVVSEETGKISVASFGDIVRDVSPKRVEDLLAAHPRRRDPRQAPAESPQPALRDISSDEAVREAKGL